MGEAHRFSGRLCSIDCMQGFKYRSGTQILADTYRYRSGTRLIQDDILVLKQITSNNPNRMGFRPQRCFLPQNPVLEPIIERNQKKSKNLVRKFQLSLKNYISDKSNLFSHAIKILCTLDSNF